MNELFRKIAHATSRLMGSPWAFLLAVGVIVLWAATGWYFDFSNTWQLVINTGTTIVTFLMVFLIQNTQNRDAHATHLKLDELIRAIKPADNEFIDVEDLPDNEIDKLAEHFNKYRVEQERRTRHGQKH